MKTRRSRQIEVAIAVAACLAGALGVLYAQQAPSTNVTIGGTDLGGVVSGPNGPEAGVWVIAETTDLPTKFSKVVVSDDLGRYVIPDLPKASYNVWVRGYGLVDSPKVKAVPGKNLNLTAVLAPTAAAAAEYYPGVYWYSMLQIPAKSEFPGTGQTGNGINPVMKTQPYWIDTVKNSCQSCHALGSKGIRTLPKEWGSAANSIEAWNHRLQAGQAKANMALTLGRLGPKRHSPFLRTGPTALRPANFLSPSRSGLRASSATSSLVCGSGPLPRRIFTMPSRPTSVIRASTPTA